MIVQPHGYSEFKEKYRDNERLEVRVESTEEGRCLAYLLKIQDSHGYYGNSTAKTHRIVEERLLEFSLSSLGKIKAKKKAIRLLKQTGKYNPNTPININVRDNHQITNRPLYI